MFGAVFACCATRTHASIAAIPHGTVQLIAENPSIAPGHTVSLGLQFRLEPGWHIYWINPGDSGEPPRVKWHLPAGVTAGAIAWPTPKRLGTATIVDYGYDDAVTLLVPIHAAAHLPAQQAAELAAEVNVLVCREMCIPGKAQVSLILPIQPKLVPPDAAAMGAFVATRRSLARAAPKNWRFRVAEESGSFVLTANVGWQITQAVFFPLVPSQIDNAAEQKLVPAATGLQLTLRKSDQLLKPIERLKGVLVFSGDRAYLVDVPVGKAGA